MQFKNIAGNLSTCTKRMVYSIWMSYCKFWIYWVGVNTKFTIWQHKTSCFSLDTRVGDHTTFTELYFGVLACILKFVIFTYHRMFTPTSFLSLEREVICVRYLPPGVYKDTILKTWQSDDWLDLYGMIMTLCGSRIFRITLHPPLKSLVATRFKHYVTDISCRYHSFRP